MPDDVFNAAESSEPNRDKESNVPFDFVLLLKNIAQTTPPNSPEYMQIEKLITEYAAEKRKAENFRERIKLLKESRRQLIIENTATKKKVDNFRERISLQRQAVQRKNRIIEKRQQQIEEQMKSQRKQAKDNKSLLNTIEIINRVGKPRPGYVSQKFAAEVVDRTVVTISRWDNGQNTPDGYPGRKVDKKTFGNWAIEYKRCDPLRLKRILEKYLKEWEEQHKPPDSEFAEIAEMFSQLEIDYTHICEKKWNI